MTQAWWLDWNQTFLDDEYGPTYGANNVQSAVVTTLEKWMPTYIAAVNRNVGTEALYVPIDYRHRPDYRTLPKSHNVAAVLVSVPGTSSEPLQQQYTIRSDWRAEVQIFIYGTKDWQQTEAFTQAYATCVRTLLIQQRALGGFAQTTKWDGEQYHEGEHNSGRTIGIATVRFVVTVGSVMNPMGGPPAPDFAATGTPTGPDTNAPPAIPTVVTTDTTVSN